MVTGARDSEGVVISSGMEEPDQQTHTDFDSLFILDEADQQQLVAKQQIHRGQGSGASTPHRGSPARRNQVTGAKVGVLIVLHLPWWQAGGSCKHHGGPPGDRLSAVAGAGVRHSHSMRDQTSHMKEKYQAR